MRCVRDSKLLAKKILDFLEYLERKLELETDIEMIEDLVNFQVFALSTMDRKEPIKKQIAKYAWKEFLINSVTSTDALTRGTREYSWKNKVTESDRAQWCYKAIWIGRNQGNYKCHPEFLIEATIAE